jgi:hypothetical protein
MKSLRSRFLRTLVGTAALVGMTAIPASASSANGELCSVQTNDGSVRAGAHTADDRTARSATRHQINNAAGWCTDQIAVSGWMGADKNYDRYKGQLDVCYIHFPGDDVSIFLHADSDDTYAIDFAARMCRDVAGGDMSLIHWY